MSRRRQLSELSVKIFTLMNEGKSCQQIVERHPDITRHDIFDAAEEALELDKPSRAYRKTLAEIKEKHPRAYEPWSTEEEGKLLDMNSQDLSISEIAAVLQRQPSAIRRRLNRFGFPGREPQL